MLISISMCSVYFGATENLVSINKQLWIIWHRHGKVVFSLVEVMQFKVSGREREDANN